MGLANFNPLKKDRQNYPGVVIALADVPRPTYAKSLDPEKKDDSSTDDPKILDRAPSAENGSTNSLSEASHWTIEALRAEIEAETSSSGHDSVYDRTSPLVRPQFHHRSARFLTISFAGAPHEWPSLII